MSTVPELGLLALVAGKRTGGSRQTLAAVACGGGGGTAGGSNKCTIGIASDYPASGGEASTGIPELQAVAFVPGHRHPKRGCNTSTAPEGKNGR